MVLWRYSLKVHEETLELDLFFRPWIYTHGKESNAEESRLGGLKDIFALENA